jgi:rod shape determining protein RodA
MYLDIRYIKHFDWYSLLLVLLISSIGLISIYSSTYQENINYSIFFKKQLFGIISGIFIYIILSIYHYKDIERFAYFAYYFSILLLIFTLFKGSIGLGAKRWISLGIIKFQPSELIKLFSPPFTSYYLSNIKYFNCRFNNYIFVIFSLFITSFLVLKQPDLGTAIIILLSGLSTLWMAGLNRKFFIITFVSILISSPLLWKFLKDYQKNRIMVFIGYGSSKKERYQIEQSQIAIGSGGIYGKGFLQGTQNTLRFLPESRTDFIFSILAEEFGFIGVAILITLYLILFFRLLYIIYLIDNFFAKVLAFGLIIHIIFSSIINIFMVIGLMPIVGIPLPFMSYGISHIWISFASLGIFNSIATRRFYLTAVKL